MDFDDRSQPDLLSFPAMPLPAFHSTGQGAKPVESEVGLSGGPFRHSDHLASRRRTSERADAIIQVEVGGGSTNQRTKILQPVTCGMLLL